MRIRNERHTAAAAKGRGERQTTEEDRKRIKRVKKVERTNRIECVLEMRGMPPPRRKDVASDSSRRRSAGLGTGTGRVARDAMTNAAFKKKKEGPTDASRRKGVLHRTSLPG